MDIQAAACGTSVAPDGFVFSLDPTCSTPLRPELLTRRMRRLRKELGATDGSFDPHNPPAQVDNEQTD